MKGHAEGQGIRRALTALAVFLVGTLAPVGVGHAQTPEEADCRSELADSVYRYARASLKQIAKCHKLRSRGKIALSVDCNNVAQADPANRLERERDRLRDSITGAGAACTATPAVLGQYGRCPSPSQLVDDAGATDGIDDFAELGACFIGLVESVAGQASREALGLPIVTLKSKASRCQKTLGKGLANVMLTSIRERSACQADLDQAANGLGYGCSGVDSSDRIGDAITKARSGVAGACSNMNDDPALTLEREINQIGACGDTVAQLRDCAISRAAADSGSGLAAMAFELPSDCRAGSILRIANSAFGQQITDSDFSAGWKGVAHNIDLTDRFQDRLVLDCDADCANCTLALDTDKAKGDSFCRCESDATKNCDVINGPDADDCTGGLSNQCNCYFGPPAGVSAAGAPACVVIKTTAPHTGTLDLGTGEWHNPVNVAALIYLGTDLARPCPVCMGDPTANDGVRGGTCGGGTRDGDACDVNAVQATFGPSSYDCMPTTLTNISGTGLPLDLALTSDDSSLPFELPCDTAGDCPCRVCSDDTAIGCSSDARCAAFEAGTCTGTGGAGNEANECADGVCGANGECPAGPVDKYCDGTTYADGTGYITCFSDADCGLTGAGGCTITERRKCYTDPITIDGRPGFFGAKIGGIGCIGVTTSIAINEASGLPGAVRVGLDVDLDTKCGGAKEKENWEPPAGANCVVTGTPTTSTTSTTLLPQFDCESAFPICALGVCPNGETCGITGLACGCSP